VKRNSLIAGIVLVVVAIATLIFTMKKHAPAPAPGAKDNSDPGVVEMNPEARQNAEFVIGEAAKRPLRQVVKTTGVVSPDQSRVAHVFPLARGIVEKVHVQLGSKVRAGEPLLDFDNIELGQLIGEYLNLRGQLAKLQAQQQVSRKILDRAEALIKIEGISRQELEVRQAEFQQAVAGVEGQQADVARVEEQLHRFGLTDDQIHRLSQGEHGTHRIASHDTLRAPISGIITKYNVSPGEVVDRGKELFTVVNVSSLWVEADVYEKDIGLVQSGGEAQITVASYPDRVFTGKITYVSDFLDPSSRTAKVRCVVRNSSGLLKLEMFATVEIPGAEVRRALTVPTAALQQIGNETVVFVQQDATHYRKRVVEPGERAGDWVEIRQGLKPGERVVAEGGFYLKSLFLREQISGEE
jgi:membrane fusion protein, heavy metal efflux system